MQRTLILLLLTLLPFAIKAQELEVKVTVNRQQVGNTTRTDVFDALQEKVTSFMNERQWTTMTFQETERINVNLLFTVATFNDADNAFTCELTVTAQRPVYNSSYTTTTYATVDRDVAFSFQPTDQLEFQGADRVDNNLIAILAYYAYMIIGYDMDSFAPLGGTQYFQIAQDICTQGDNLGYKGWKAFGEKNNRFGLLDDYMDGSMEPYRQMIYKYHREGLDQMADNVEQGRAAILECIDLLDQSRSARSMTVLPQLFSEYKGDELVNIFKGKGSREERQKVYDVLLSIDASRNSKWDEIKN